MYIYIIAFAETTLFAYLAQKFQNKKMLVIIFSILAILGPSIVAGVRDLNIGTDVEVYGIPFFNRAVSSDSFSEYSKKCDTEIGYRVINYVVSRFTSNVHIFLFVLEFITLGIVYIAFYQQRDRIPVWLAMLCYLFLFYNRMLNLLRQGVAVSIIIYSYQYIEKKEYKKYLVGVIIATLFHTTGIFAITLYLISILLQGKYKKTYLIGISIITIVVIFSYGNILSFLIYNVGIISDRYAIYIPDKTFKFYFVETFIITMMFIIEIIFSKKMNKVNENNLLYLYVSFFGIILLQLRGVADYADRIAFYYTAIYPIAIAEIPKHVGKRKIDKIILNLFIVILFFLYWYWKYINQGSCDTYPYTSNILGIF